MVFCANLDCITTIQEMELLSDIMVKQDNGGERGPNCSFKFYNVASDS